MASIFAAHISCPAIWAKNWTSGAVRPPRLLCELNVSGSGDCCFGNLRLTSTDFVLVLGAVAGVAVLLARESTQVNRWLQAFGMSNLRYTYCFGTRQNQDAARPTRFPDHGASRKGQSRAACSLVSLPSCRRYQGTAGDHGQDCGRFKRLAGMTRALEKRSVSEPNFCYRLATTFAYFSGFRVAAKRFVYEGLRGFKINPWDARGCGIETTHANTSQQQIALGIIPPSPPFLRITEPLACHESAHCRINATDGEE